MKLPEHLFVYRMTHINNVPFIAANGLWSKLSGVVDPNFVPIGNTDIINKRTIKQVVVIPPGGTLGEYIPFYFAGHSPMLLNIVTGHGVSKIPQRDIAFLVCDAIEMTKAGIQYCFTDGNAAHSITKFYNSLKDINKLDWNTIKATIWHNTDEDYDRVRKKMAEFLAKEHIPSNMIKGIIVHNEDAQTKVLASITTLLPGVPVVVDKDNNLFYQQYD